MRVQSRIEIPQDERPVTDGSRRPGGHQAPAKSGGYVMDNPLVSIITCTFNRAGMLKETISSILTQRYDPVESIVIDDGSTDGTADAMAAYTGKIRYYRQENRGMEASLNFACRRLARGEYIAINDDDDIMLPYRISRLCGALLRFPRAVLAVGDVEIIDAQGGRGGVLNTFNAVGRPDRPILIENGYEAILWPLITPVPCATIFRRADGERVGWFDEGFRRGSDTDFFGRLARLGPIVYVPEVVACYRRGHPSKWDGRPENRLLCELANAMLFEKHLKFMYAGGRKIRDRLKTRMLCALERLAFLRANGEALPGEDMPNGTETVAVRKGLSALDMKRRLYYEWYLRVRLPLAAAVKRALKKVRAAAACPAKGGK